MDIGLILRKFERIFKNKYSRFSKEEIRDFISSAIEKHLKTLLLMLSIALMILILTSNEVSTFTDWSSTGWTASTGRSWMPGNAINSIPINNGWQFICQGTSGTCYEIIGPWLIINDYGGEGTEDEGDPVQVTKN